MKEKSRNELLQPLPWLTREDFLASLTQTDIENFLEIESFVINKTNLYPRFKEGKAGLFIVGSRSVPRSLLGRQPKDIDLLLTLEKGPSNTQELGLLTRSIVNSFNESDLATKFNLYFDWLRYLYKPFVRFQPSSSCHVDLFLPFIGENQTVDSFLKRVKEKQEMLMSKLEEISPDDPKGNLKREILLEEAYVIRLS